ncbi:MAG: hypothetical protein H7175_23820, partial [Burkholderiales bacterium]|nr:hypothetical protein [Anaerolineae bacterium]
TIIGGPDYSQGYTWWQLRAPSNATGWAVESADNIDTLIPSQSTSSNNQPSTCSGAPDPLFSVGDTVVMDFSFGGAMRILTHPDGGVRDAVGQAYDGHQLLLLEGPVCSESNRGWVWFVEHLPSGLTGWVLEAVSGDRYMCPLSDANCAS